MFITNNHNPFHLWWKEILIKYKNVSKYYDQDCSNDTAFSKYSHFNPLMHNVPKWSTHFKNLAAFADHFGILCIKGLARFFDFVKVDKTKLDHSVVGSNVSSRQSHYLWRNRKIKPESSTTCPHISIIKSKHGEGPLRVIKIQSLEFFKMSASVVKFISFLIKCNFLVTVFKLHTSCLNQ